MTTRLGKKIQRNEKDGMALVKWDEKNEMREIELLPS